MDPLDAEAAAVVRALHRDVVVSHAHAARLWGLPEPIRGWPPLSVTATSGPTRRRDGLHVLVAPCPDDEITGDGRGIPVTSLARTVADCLRTLTPHDGLAVADAACRRHGLSQGDLLITVRRQGGWPGVVRARTLAALACARRESPLESWSAWAFHDCAVTPPTWQIEIRTPSGAFVGRTDCWWRAGVAGEADGRSKALLSAAELGGADAATLGELLARERHREQAIRRLGAEVVRWGPRDVLDRGRALELAGHLHRVIRDRRPDRFVGRTRPAHAPLVTPAGADSSPITVAHGA